LRPKGRGRPQRILTGSWPEDHVHGVIRAVVFRDPSSLPRHIDREDASKLTANRSSGSSMSRLLTVHPAHQQSIQVFSPLNWHFVWLLATSVKKKNTFQNRANLVAEVDLECAAWSIQPWIMVIATIIITNSHCHLPPTRLAHLLTVPFGALSPVFANTIVFAKLKY
jgi:hypothetical protein